MSLRNLFSKKTQLSRRTALKGAVIGTASLLPSVIETPGVNAASLGANRSDIKALPLTGKLLQQEFKNLRVLSQFTSTEGFLSQKGFIISDPVVEGYYLYRQTAGQWSKEIFLTVGYIYAQDSTTVAAVTYSRGLQASTLDIVIAHTKLKAGKAYLVHQNGTIESIAQFETKSIQGELTVAQQYETALQVNAVNPQNAFTCWLCRISCSGVSNYGCGWLGAAFTCGEICVETAENPVCLSICAIVYRLICTSAGIFDCSIAICVNTLHVC